MSAAATSALVGNQTRRRQAESVCDQIDVAGVDISETTTLDKPLLFEPRVRAPIVAGGVGGSARYRTPLGLSLDCGKFT